MTCPPNRPSTSQWSEPGACKRQPVSRRPAGISLLAFARRHHDRPDPGGSIKPVAAARSWAQKEPEKRGTGKTRNRKNDASAGAWPAPVRPGSSHHARGLFAKPPATHTTARRLSPVDRTQRAAAGRRSPTVLRLAPELAFPNLAAAQPKTQPDGGLDRHVAPQAMVFQADLSHRGQRRSLARRVGEAGKK